MITTKRTKEALAYRCQYPSVLPWSKRLWVLQPNDVLERDGIRYRVSQVIRPQIPGAKPRIVLVRDEALRDPDPTDTTRPGLPAVLAGEDQSLPEHPAKTNPKEKAVYRWGGPDGPKPSTAHIDF